MKRSPFIIISALALFLGVLFVGLTLTQVEDDDSLFIGKVTEIDTVNGTITVENSVGKYVIKAKYDNYEWVSVNKTTGEVLRHDLKATPYSVIVEVMVLLSLVSFVFFFLSSQPFHFKDPFCLAATLITSSTIVLVIVGIITRQFA